VVDREAKDILDNPSGNKTEVNISTVTPTATPTLAPDTASLFFKIKFQGINHQASDKEVKVVLKQNGQIAASFDHVSLSSDADGIYSGIIEAITPGTYEVYVKGWVHLQKRLGSLTLTAGGRQERDWSQIELLAGDITGHSQSEPDNKIDGADYAVFADLFNPFEEAPAGTKADFDDNGYVDGGDYALLAGNFDPFGGGDE